MKIGLVGWDVAVGLGRYNYDLALHLGVHEWLVPEHPLHPGSGRAPLPVCRRVSRTPPRDTLLDFLDGLDWLLFVETPYIAELPDLARACGVRVAAIPMAENVNPRMHWVPQVDLMLPPTRHCEELLAGWRERHGFAWRVARVPGSVDTDRFAFRQRGVCERFLFCNGHGGYAGRKGARCIAEAARLAPEVPLLVYSQTPDLPAMPRNVEVRPAVGRPEELYAEGEVCVQPSRWEGMGLQLLESQACGLPLVTSDGPPMSEYRPYRRIAVEHGTLDLNGEPFSACEARPDHLAALLLWVWRTDVREASRAARQFILEHHSWSVNAPRLKSLLEGSGRAAGIPGPARTPPAIPDRSPDDGPSAARARGSGAEPTPGLEDLIPPSARRVLDVGCGAGHLGARLKERRPVEVYGIERGRRRAARARERVDHVLVGDVERLEPDFVAGQFDCLVCDGVLECLRDPERFLRRVRAWLAPGGALVARVPNVRHHRVVGALLDGTWGHLPGEPLGRGHLRFFTRREIEKAFYRAGFAIRALSPVPGPGHQEWVHEGRPARVQVGGLHIDGIPEEEAEEYYASAYLVQAVPSEAPEYGLTSIILVTHNQLPFTRECIDSIRLRTDEPYELVCVDNASTDGTVPFLRSLPDARVIVNAENCGFPAAVNQGIRAAAGKQILLLNNDTVVTTGWLGRMLHALRHHPQCGLVGPCSNRVSGEQQVPVSYEEDLTSLDGFAWDWGKANDRLREETDRLVGFCLLIRREVVDSVGPFDERFGVGCFEDDDYCLRALKAGYRAVIARDAFVHHFGGRTFVGSGVDFAALMRRNESLFHDKWRQGGDRVGVAPSPQRTPGLFGLRRSAGGGLLLTPRDVLLSLSMIVRNNAQTIGPCLSSIRPYVDEMIVVDTGSEDDTPRIATELGARVFHLPWPDSFSAARNESLRHARGRWVFWMDSDDTISPDNGRKLRALAEGEPASGVLGYVMQVHCPGPGPDGDLDMTVVDHVKLFRNLPDLRFEGRIHEQILPAIRRRGGATAWTDVFVVHSGYDHTPEGQERKKQRDLKLLHLELEDQPDHPFTLYNLGMTYTDIGEYARGMEFLNRSIRQSGESESHLRKAYSLLVYCQGRLGRAGEARQTCERALRRFPEDVELRFRQAILLHEAGRLPEAAAAYLKILHEPGPRYFTSVDRGITGFKARQNLALVYGDQGDWSRAEEQWRLIVQEVPRYRPGWRGLAEVLLRRGKTQEAAALAEQLLAEKASQADGLLLCGHVAAASGDAAEAKRRFREAAAARPSDPEPLEVFSRFVFDRDEPTEAEAALRELVRLRPEDAAAHHNLGTVYTRQGRAIKAAEAYRRSVQLRPDSVNSWLRLAEALQDGGRWREAEDAWKEVVRLDPGNAEAAAGLSRTRERASP